MLSRQLASLMCPGKEKKKSPCLMLQFDHSCFQERWKAVFPFLPLFLSYLGPVETRNWFLLRSSDYLWIIVNIFCSAKANPSPIRELTLALENEVFHFRELYCQISINVLPFSMLMRNLAIFSLYGKLDLPFSFLFFIPSRNPSCQYENLAFFSFAFFIQKRIWKHYLCR